MAKPTALGKGLGALISNRPATPLASPTPVIEKGEMIQSVTLDRIIPSPLQPRKVFNETHLQELVESIREHGIVQPLICRPNRDQFELIAGERRWRASQIVGLKEVPILVREASDQDVLELALIENIQRSDLNPIEEAKAFLRLAQEFSMKQEDIAKRVGMSRASIANTLRLLDLDPQLQTWISQERLTVGHAKVLLSFTTHEEQLAAGEEVLRKGLTVRATETLVAQQRERTGQTKQARSKKESGLVPALQRVQNRLQRHLGTHVVLQHGEKRGKIEIEYYGTDDLNRVLQVLGLPHEER
ncbi:MAG: ParB/RepB/Spo0J family partition protein [Verrucomicrobiota bacterium]